MPPTDPEPDEPGSTQIDTQSDIRSDAPVGSARDGGRAGTPAADVVSAAERAAPAALRAADFGIDTTTKTTGEAIRGLRAEPAQRRPRLPAGAARPARAVRAVHRARQWRHLPQPAEPGQPAPAGRRPDDHRDGPGVRAAHRRDRPGGRHRVRARRRGAGPAPGEQRQPARRDGQHGVRRLRRDHGSGGRARGMAADLGRCGIRRPGAGTDPCGLPAERLVRDAARGLRGRGDRRAHRLPGREARHAVVRGHPRAVHLLAGRDPAAHRRWRHAGPARPGARRGRERQHVDARQLAAVRRWPRAVTRRCCSTGRSGGASSGSSPSPPAWC